MKFKVGSRVQWYWVGCPIKGVVSEVYTHPVSKLIKGKKIKRNGSEEKPAYLVLSAAGNFALKLHTELTALPRGKSQHKKVKDVGERVQR